MKFPPPTQISTQHEKPRTAFTLIELLSIVAIAVVVVGILVFSIPRANLKSERIQCVNNLKNIGLAFRIFATDHSDLFPADILASNDVAMTSIDIVQVYSSISKELVDPKLLYCPSDKQRNPASSFASISRSNISYFAGVSTRETNPQALLAGDRNVQTNGVQVGPGLLTISTNMELSFSQGLHVGQGDILMGDGSVQQMTATRLKDKKRLAGQKLLIP